MQDEGPTIATQREHRTQDFPDVVSTGARRWAGRLGSHPLCMPRSFALHVPLSKGSVRSTLSESGVCAFLLIVQLCGPSEPHGVGVITEMVMVFQAVSPHKGLGEGVASSTGPSYAPELCWRAAVGLGAQDH